MPEGMATTLKTRLVGLTAGPVNPRKLIWKGSSRNAPETPPIDVKKETTNAATGGIQGDTSTPAMGKNIETSLRHQTLRPVAGRPFFGLPQALYEV